MKFDFVFKEIIKAIINFSWRLKKCKCKKCVMIPQTDWSTMKEMREKESLECGRMCIWALKSQKLPGPALDP